MSDDDWGQPPRVQNEQPAPAPMQQPNQQMVQQPGPPAKIKHQLETNDIIPLVLSFFLPGAGHIMAGQTMKGIALLAFTFFTCGSGYLLVLFVIADCFFVINCKKDRQVGDWEFFPDYNRYI